MSDSAESRDPEEAAEGEKAGTDQEGDVPEIEADEMADFSSVAEEIEEGPANQGEGRDGEGSDEGDDTRETSEEQGADGAPNPAEMNVSVGTVYCNGLGMMGALASCKYGSGDQEERDQLAEDYAQMAQQIELDTYTDQLLAESGGLDGLGPGQAVLLGTLMWGSMIAVQDPEMAGNLMEEVR